MARSAGIWNARPFGLNRRDEAKGVSSYKIVLDGLLDVGHVASHTITASTSRRVVCVAFDRALQPSRIVLVVASEADSVASPDEI